jgi:4-amino-4-deoxy-L-arabinose transferase-like glycosyltransferase
LLLKTFCRDARLNRLQSTPPIRSLAPEEGSFEIPLWGVPLVLMILWVCLFSGLGAIGLVGPDEPRYAAIARAMAETHDWITPRLWGTPWFEKPVLYYWTAGLAMRLFGVSEFAARLPSALAGLLAVAAAAWAALRSYGIGAAWYTLLILPTSVAMIGFSRAAGPDMLFAALLTAAMAVAVEILQRDKPGPIWQIAFGFFLGAAVLAKGPAAAILAGGATLAWAAISRQWLAPFRLLHPVVLAAFGGTALPWYVLCALRNPDFLRVFIWQHNFERYTTPIFEHRQPIWFFLPVFLLGILPWMPALTTVFVDAKRSARSAIENRSPSLFIACWAAFTLLFFSLSQSKLPGYILPAIPPGILLLARSLRSDFVWHDRLRKIAILSTGFATPLVLVLALAKLHASIDARTQLYASLMKAFEISLLPALLGCGLVVGFSFARKLNAVVWTTVLSVAALVALANQMILPRLDATTVRPAAEWTIGMHSLRPQDVAVLGLPRSYQYGLNYYFNSTLSEWTPENEHAKVVFCGDEAATSTHFPNRIDAPVPATPDGKVQLVLLRPQTTK